MKNLILTIVIAATTCSCTHTILNPIEDIPQNPIEKSGGFKYYVIDINSDIPDAFFETYEEAALYQDDFSENHEYVIVKIEKGYKVYNMEPNDKITVSEKFSKK